MQTVEPAAGGLRGILDGLMKIEGITAALVVGRDGFVIESVTNGEGIDGDTVGALASSSFGSFGQMGGELRLGTLDSVLLEYEMGPVAVSPAGPEAVLAVIADHRANLGRLRIEMRKIRTAVANQL